MKEFIKGSEEINNEKRESLDGFYETSNNSKYFENLTSKDTCQS